MSRGDREVLHRQRTALLPQHAIRAGGVGAASSPSATLHKVSHQTKVTVCEMPFFQILTCNWFWYRQQFDWIDGLSITEMEVLHGALRSKNPNALFLKRHPSFLQNVPTDHKKLYQVNNFCFLFQTVLPDQISPVDIILQTQAKHISKTAENDLGTILVRTV